MESTFKSTPKFKNDDNLDKHQNGLNTNNVSSKKALNDDKFQNVLRHRHNTGQPKKNVTFSNSIQINKTISKVNSNRNVENDTDTSDNELNSNLPHSKSQDSSLKNIVFNGTYPIDKPYSSRFDLGDDEFSDNYPREPSNPNALSIQELINNKNIKLNCMNMRKEFQTSVMKFEEYLARKNVSGDKPKLVKTFSIDEPY